MRDLQASSRRASKIIGWGIFVNIVLAAIKISAGFLGNSQALIADGIESALDVISSLMILGAMQYAGRPADEAHPYGHGKIESLAGVAGALVLLGAGILVAISSIHSLWQIWFSESQIPELPSIWTLVVLVVVVLAKETLFRFLFKLGKEIDSKSMETDAWHHRSDAITSIAAFLGISIALIGGAAWASADSWAALFSCGIILFNGFRMLRGSFGEVIDEQASPEFVEEILQIASGVEGVLGVEKCRVRKSGLSRIADLHVRVSGEISVRSGHEIAHQVVHVLMCRDNLNLGDVTVHIEPEPIPGDYTSSSG